MRHAKAEQAGPTDFERELADTRPRDAAPPAGAWLTPARASCPTAPLCLGRRAHAQTWSAVAAGRRLGVEPTFERGLYAAGPETALDLICGPGRPCCMVVVIGHNPTMAYLAQLLDDGEGDVGRQRDGMGYPTSAVAVFDFDGEWADLDAGRLHGSSPSTSAGADRAVAPGPRAGWFRAAMWGAR